MFIHINTSIDTHKYYFSILRDELKDRFIPSYYIRSWDSIDSHIALPLKLRSCQVRTEIFISSFRFMGAVQILMCCKLCVYTD